MNLSIESKVYAIFKVTQFMIFLINGNSFLRLTQNLDVWNDYGELLKVCNKDSPHFLAKNK